jgi:pyrimidine operon attenuation protein / uracil phosphoribosyltransferase
MGVFLQHSHDANFKLQTLKCFYVFFNMSDKPVQDKAQNSFDINKSVLLMDAVSIERSVTRISYEILERDDSSLRLAIVGIKTCGEFLAKRIAQQIVSISGRRVEFGVVDITLYRDDIGRSGNYPVLRGTDLSFEVSSSRIILVDDVLYTGRTIRAALDAIIDFGRPRRVELAVLVDRGHRELPIRPDYVGKNLPSKYEDRLVTRLSEQGEQDGVYLNKGAYSVEPKK